MYLIFCIPNVPINTQSPDDAYRADSRFAPSQWETALLSNDVSNWLGTNLESALCIFAPVTGHQCFVKYIFAFK